MDTSVGIELLVAGTLVGLLTAFVARPRIGPRATFAVLAAAGACLGAGAIVVQARDVNAVNWAAAVLGGALILPLQAWAVFGPPRAGATS